jgi:Protein of unknown function (DUF3293)
MAEISEELLNSYLRTTYFVLANTSLIREDIGLRIGETSAALDTLLARFGAPRWAYLTAYNPQSTALEAADNAHRQAKLLSTLASGDYRVFPGRSVADTEDWPDEESVLVVEIHLDCARKLAADFGQYGFLFGESHGPVELVLC